MFYELRNGLLQSAFPVFVDGTEISKSGYLAECDRRTELGKLIVESPYLDKTIVNRMWQHFLGYGFTKPIDDLGPHNPPSHPGLLDYLGEEFRKNSFDLKELIRWIVLSEPYSLSSKITAEQQGRRSAARRDAEVHALLPAADAGRRAVRIAARRHRGPQDPRQLRRAGEAEGRLAAAVRDRLRHRRRGRSHDVQRHDSAGPDDVERRPDQEGDRAPRRAASCNVVASSNIKPGDKIEYLFEAALARKPDAATKSASPTSCSSPARATRPRPCKTCSGPCSTATSSSCSTNLLSRPAISNEFIPATLTS